MACSRVNCTFIFPLPKLSPEPVKFCDTVSLHRDCVKCHSDSEKCPPESGTATLLMPPVPSTSRPRNQSNIKCTVIFPCSFSVLRVRISQDVFTPKFCRQLFCVFHILVACSPHRRFHYFNYTGRGTAVTQWLKCCVTNRKVAGSIPAGVIGIFH